MPTPCTTSLSRRRPTLGVLCIALLAGCSSVGNDPSTSPSRPTPTPSLVARPAHPFVDPPAFVEPHQRTVLDDVESFVTPGVVYEGAAAQDYDMPVVSPTYYALWPPDDIHSANIYALDSHDLVATISVPSDGYRYLGKILLSGTDAYVVDSPDWDHLDTDPDSRISRLDLLTGASTELEPPAGQQWSFLPNMIAELDGMVVALTQTPNTHEPCLVRIDGMTPSPIQCWEGATSDRLSIMPGYVSQLVWPQEDNPDACTQRHLTSFDGHTREIGDRRHCRGYDGITLNGWDIWSSNDQGVISESTVYADGPDGEHLQLSRKSNKSGSMVACGKAAYWKASFAHQGEPADAIMRWAPGMENVEMVFQSDPGHVLRPPTCDEGIISFTTDDFTTSPISTRVLYLDARELDAAT